MTPEEWQRVRPLLESALQLQSSVRTAFLDKECTDPTLRKEVESLIAAHDEASTDCLNPTGPPVFNFEAEPERDWHLAPGTRVGPYEIVGEIAEGGMGAVYRAVRADGEYKQQVAVKIMRADLAVELTASRFRKERQILAGLDHPNIAKILDGGTTSEGLPYFVMEFIEGLPITEYCDRNKYSIDARLRIFRATCSAVHYAHQRLIIHRDIKPTNILVTAEGVPKLLDFGIAKILDPDVLPENTTISAPGQWMMTPEYASPEQLRGEPISTVADVYALGLVLYELLAGRRAYRFASRTPQAIVRTLMDTEPDKPSTALYRQSATVRESTTAAATPEQIATQRGDSPKRLRHRLAGDLDNIVLKAIRKEPLERYSSADQLSEDIRRYQEGLPVLARKGNSLYHFRKYIRRHKTVVSAAALAALSLLTGIVLAVREARIARANEQRAERRFNDVRALANSLMTEVHDSIKDLAGATPARKLLVSKALQYLNSLSQESAGDPGLQSELAAAYEKVGDVQGYPDTANLGDSAGAVASYRSALTLRQALANANPSSTDAQQNLASDFERIAVLQEEELGDYRGALENYRKDFAIRQKVATAAPSPQALEYLAGAYFLTARDLSDLEDRQGALENYKQAATLRESIQSPPPGVRMRLAGTYGYMAPIQWYIGDHAGAAATQRKAQQIMAELYASDQSNATFREYLDETYYWAGYFDQKDGDDSRALENFHRALADFQKLSAADPREARTKGYVAMCLTSIAGVLVDQEKVAQAMPEVRQSLALLGEVKKPNANDDSRLADAYGVMGAAYAHLAVQPGVPAATRTADWKQAQAAYARSYSIWLDFKKRGVLTMFNMGEPDRIAAELAKCNAALAASGPATH